MHFASIPSKHIKTLTKILQLKSKEDPISYSNRTISLISSLPSSLRRPNRLTLLVLRAQSSFTPLCPLHKPLHASVVHAIYNLVALEVGIRINSLMQNSLLLTPSQWQIVRDLRECHALWLRPELYEKTFLAKPGDLQWKYQADHCEACMLARLAGDLPTLLKLRHVLLSRTTHRSVEKYGEPSLTRWVEAWLKNLARSSEAPGLTEDEFEGMLRMNKEHAKELRKVRKLIARKRKEASRQAGQRNEVQTVSDGTSIRSMVLPGQTSPVLPTPRSPVLPASTSPESDFEPLRLPGGTSVVDDDIRERRLTNTGSSHDAELEIIDAYEALKSTPYLPEIPRQDEPANLYPIPETIASTPQETRTASDDNHPYIHCEAELVASSVYSADTFRNNDRVISNGMQGGINTSNILISTTPSTAGYVPPRLNWKKDTNSGEDMSSANQRVKMYEDLLFPLKGPSASGSGIWEDASVAPSTRLSVLGDQKRPSGSREQLADRRTSSRASSRSQHSHTSRTPSKHEPAAEIEQKIVQRLKEFSFSGHRANDSSVAMSPKQPHTTDERSLVEQNEHRSPSRGRTGRASSRRRSSGSSTSTVRPNDTSGDRASDACGRHGSSASSTTTIKPSDSYSEAGFPLRVHSTRRGHGTTKRTSTVESQVGSVQSSSRYAPSIFPEKDRSSRPSEARNDSGETEETHVTRWSDLYKAINNSGEDFDYYKAEKEKKKKRESRHHHSSHKGKDCDSRQ